MGTGLPFDDVLVAAQAGAGWAFEVLYRDLAPRVTGYLRLHGAAEPDDLASETFLQVFTGLAGFSGDEERLRAWVFTIAHRRLVDDWRRRSRRPQLADVPDGAPESVGGDVEDDVLGRLGAADVERLCGLLPPDQRTVLLLRILADLTIEQVAGVLGRSTGATKALQRRGLRTLRDLLEQEQEDSPTARRPAGTSPVRGGTQGAVVTTAYPSGAWAR
jgi:RNA polymerase sigma-70 factor (ECF subfamily)